MDGDVKHERVQGPMSNVQRVYLVDSCWWLVVSLIND